MIRPVGEIVDGGAPTHLHVMAEAAKERAKRYPQETRPTRYKRRHRSSNRAQRRKAQANGAAHCGACQSRRVQVLRDNDTGKVIGHRCHREACRYEERSE